MIEGERCAVCGYTYAASCGRCRARIDDGNRLLNPSQYGCEACQGKRPELSKILGQEDEAHLHSKVQSG